MSAVQRRQWSAGDVAGMLAQRIDALVLELLPGARRHGQEWQAGSVSGEAGTSLGVRRTGAKAGVWADFASGERGDALDLVAATLCGGDLGDALKWALGWLGLSEPGSMPTRRAERPPVDTAREDAEVEKIRAAAHAMWLRGVADLAGTPVAAYLLGREIDIAALPRPPRALRYVPELWNAELRTRLPAMVAAIQDETGAFLATHRTYLTRDRSGLWTKAPVERSKMVLGRFAGGCIRLTRGHTGKRLAAMPPDEEACLGEGIETCLSVAVACPERRILCGVSLGNLGRVRLPAQAKRLLLLIDDDTHPSTRAALQSAINDHVAAGRTVRLARSPYGSDFNDALR